MWRMVGFHAAQHLTLWSRLILAGATATGIASIQGIALAQGQKAEFEVASIREVVDGVRIMGRFTASGPRAEYRGFGIPMLIAEAWNMRRDEISLGPGVSPNTVFPLIQGPRTARVYDIVALSSEGTAPSRDEFRLKLRALLATRFKLATHRETQNKPVYVLEKSGPLKLKTSSGEGSCRTTADRTPEGQKIVATHCPIQAMISFLFVDRPVYDETGLTEFYDFEITSALPSQTNDPQATTPFSAVRDLGLKLEAKQRPVDTIIIEHIEPPEEN